MIGIPETGRLKSAIISAVGHEGLTVTTLDGRGATLAIIDTDGNVIESGPEVAAEAWNVTLATYKNILIGKGHLRIFSSPPDQRHKTNESAAA